MGWVNLNGSLLPDKEACISISDRGFLLGDGVFETLKAIDGKVLFLEEHLQRMRNGADFLRIKIPFSKSKIAGFISELLQKNFVKHARIRITLSRGRPAKKSGLPNFDDKFSTTLLISVSNISASVAELQNSGRSCCISNIARNERSPLCSIKCISYLENLCARDEARRRGFDEAILLNTRGKVAECSTSNIFIVSGKSIITPPVEDGALPGITATTLIEAVSEQGIRVSRRSITRSKLINADEVFMTNSVIDFVPVTKVDNVKIGSGRPGQMTRKLSEIYRHFIERRLT